MRPVLAPWSAAPPFLSACSPLASVPDKSHRPLYASTTCCSADSDVLSVSRREAVKSLVVGAVVLGIAGPSAGQDDAPVSAAPKNELIERLLERSRANKAKYDKERLDNYYKRNFKEYFEFVEGTLRNKAELTDAEKGIVEWLKKNR